MKDYFRKACAMVTFAMVMMGIQPVYSQQVLEDCSGARARSIPLVAMACNIWAEAQAEPMEGKIAVGFSTINRVRHPEYPKHVAGVVWQRGQYDWTPRPRVIRDHHGVRQQWEDSLRAAMLVLVLQNDPEYERFDFTRGSTSFHAQRGNIWPNMIETAKIANHRFFVDRRGMRPVIHWTPAPHPVMVADFANDTDQCTPAAYIPDRFDPAVLREESLEQFTRHEATLAARAALTLLP